MSNIAAIIANLTSKKSEMVGSMFFYVISISKDLNEALWFNFLVNSIGIEGINKHSGMEPTTQQDITARNVQHAASVKSCQEGHE